MKKKQIIMQEELLKDIIKFLGLFNFNLPDKKYRDLFNDFYNNKKVDVLDNAGNVVGRVTNYENDLFIIINTQDKYFECLPKIKKNGRLKQFNFIMKDNNNMILRGWIKFYRYLGNEDLNIEGTYHIVNGETEIARSKFLSSDSHINLTDAISGEYINYSTKKEGKFKESNLFHNKKDITLDVICDLDNVYYKIRKLTQEIKFKDDQVIADNRYSYNGYQINNEGKSNYNIVEEEIKKVFQEYDSEVFEFIQNQKEALNYFDDNLFEKIFSRILFRLNKKSLMDIFGIEDSYKDPTYKK